MRDLCVIVPVGPAAATGRVGGDHNHCRQWMPVTFDDGPSSYRTILLRTLRSKRVPATFCPQIIDPARQLGYRFGLLNRVGTVVPATLPASRAPIPEVINPVPYLPLQSYSRGKLPPRPYVVVDPASQL